MDLKAGAALARTERYPCRPAQVRINTPPYDRGAGDRGAPIAGGERRAMPHQKKANPRFDPVKHGEALEAALVETRFQQGALVEQGDVDSMVLLGSMHFRGQGGPQDFAEARRLFQMAADLGSAAARTNLARMHMKGEGGPEDFVEARRLLDLAIEQGDDDAQVVLGHM